MQDNSTITPKVSDKANARHPQWFLELQAHCWRVLMDIGMVIHRLAPPRPPTYTFRRSIKSNFSTHPGTFRLYFYCPREWRHRKPDRKYPVIINFHGGGFTIGDARDDARWCDAVVTQVDAVVVSVEYRLAPEHPFPTGVKDGVEAILYLSEHAEELGLDVHNFAVSGFSAGGNMAFSVPLRLRAEVRAASQKDLPADADSVYSGREICGEVKAPTIKAIVAWYPSVDFTQPRDEREKLPARPDLVMPKFFTNLFDASYLQPPTLDTSSPYLSPGMAPAELLHELPDTIMIYPCEYDGLTRESSAFRERLEKEIGKNVRWREVEGVPHGWDKSPNPLWTPKSVDVMYRDACDALKVAFGMNDGPSHGFEIVTESGEVKTMSGHHHRRRSTVDQMALKQDIPHEGITTS